jgi:hypothetical protein
MTTPLSREELRAKRLRAFLGEEVAVVPVVKSATTTTNAAAVESPPPPSDLPSIASTATGSEESKKVLLSCRDEEEDKDKEVIDLCFTDSDDDNNSAIEIPSPKRAKSSSAATPKPKRTASPSGSTAVTTSRNNAARETKTQPSTSGAKPGSLGESFQVATWNVWFGPPNGPNPHVLARMSAMAQILRECNKPLAPPLWFVGFQEVTEEARDVLEKNLPEYKFVRQPSGPYYCMLGVRQTSAGSNPILLDSGCVDFRTTVCGRAFCYARVRFPAGSQQEMLVATTHLESYCGKDYTGHDERPIQLLQFEAFARAQMDRHPNLRSCLLMGDYNWDDESKSARLDDKIDRVLTLPSADVWLQYQQSFQDNRSRSKETCYTYDGPRNPMLGSRLRRRFDRCVAICRDQADLPQTTRVDLLGTTELPGLRWDKVNSFTGTSREVPTMISDHYGLLASLSFE